MFSQASVCSTLAGVTPDASWDRSHGEGEVVCPGEGGVTIPTPGSHCSPPGQYRPPPTGSHPPPDMITYMGTTVYVQAGDTHATGKHSCFDLLTIKEERIYANSIARPCKNKRILKSRLNFNYIY